MFSSPGYVPYSKHELFPKYYTYEGMESNTVLSGSGDVHNNDTTQINADMPVHTSGSGPSGSGSEPFSLSEVGNTVSGILRGNTREGFELTPSEFNTSQSLDKFSSVSANSNKNDNSCYSAGLSNSKGPLCLTPELVDLLKTRGGNM